MGTMGFEGNLFMCVVGAAVGVAVFLLQFRLNRTDNMVCITTTLHLSAAVVREL